MFTIDIHQNRSIAFLRSLLSLFHCGYRESISKLVLVGPKDILASLTNNYLHQLPHLRPTLEQYLAFLSSLFNNKLQNSVVLVPEWTEDLGQETCYICCPKVCKPADIETVPGTSQLWSNLFWMMQNDPNFVPNMFLCQNSQI